MGPRVKKTTQRKPKQQSATLENEGETEKENKSPKKPVIQDMKITDKSIKNKTNEDKQCEGKPFALSLKPPLTTKPVGFWSKKLQDLEESIDNKKCKLYEFSGTDESESSYKKKKKPKPKAKPRRKKQIATIFKPVDHLTKLPEKKLKQIHNKSLCREQIMLTKERKKLADTGKKFTFSTGMPYLGVTSTPAVKKDNLVGASNFQFLSPIILDEKTENLTQLNKYSPVGLKQDQNNLVVEVPQHLNHETPKKGTQNNSGTNCLDSETPKKGVRKKLVAKKLKKDPPKAETKLANVSCRRVLRNGRVIKM